MATIQAVLDQFRKPNVTLKELMWPYYQLKYAQYYESLSPEQEKMLDGVQGLLYPKPPKMTEAEFYYGWDVAVQHGAITQKRLDVIKGEIETWALAKEKENEL